MNECLPLVAENNAHRRDSFEKGRIVMEESTVPALTDD